MAGRLRETTVADICQVFDGPHATPTKTTVGPIFLGITSLNKGRIDLAGSEHLSEEDFAKWTRRVTPRAGDVVFSYETKLGEAAIIPEGLRCCLGRRMALMRPDPNKTDGRFLLYYYLGPEFQDVIRERTIHGSTVERLALIEFPKFPLRLPPLAEQKAIAAVLGALDDKIELNWRMNATLEAMARALFQSWFVDFDPVRAKLDGREPGGLDAATAALFPATFHDSEVGHIPHGWILTTLGEACDKGGGNIQTGPFGTQLHASDYVSEGIPSIMPSDLRDNRIDPSSIARIREQDAARLSVYRVQTGDVVYSRRGDVERRSLIRHAEKGWLCGTGCLRVRFGPRGLNPHFGAAYLGTSESRSWIVRHAVGATMPNLNTSILGALPLIVPPAELQSRFAELVGTWDERGTIALEQSRTLATLRDTLLPKLLSGELTAPAIQSLAHLL
ncbi:MAG: restriction endonuclease subunit S [Rhodocyclaceae bacterium]|nr:restriction endonuclease subunit S [Rhodocyclaceae bacterium]